MPPRRNRTPAKPATDVPATQITVRQSSGDLVLPSPTNAAGKERFADRFRRLVPEPAERQRLAKLLRSAIVVTPVSEHTPHPEQPGYGHKMLQDDRIITKGESRYYPISLAAECAQVPRTTLLNWINAKVKFQGRALQTYNSPTARKSFLKEESVERVANRFIKWPSKDPAGSVVIGETDDQTGYIGIAKAAKSIGVDHHTIWLWIKQGKTPAEKPLNVIKCSVSDQLYIHERDILEIKKVIPRSGLRRGRPPRQAAQPS